MTYKFSKTLRFITLFLSFSCIVLISSCSKNDSSSNDIPVAVAPIIPGIWIVHYYFNVTEKTSNYVAYTFTFNSNGTFTAIKTGASYSGTWSDVIDSGKRKFILNFDSSVTESALLELEEDWIVVSSSASLITLQNNAVQLQFMKK